MNKLLQASADRELNRAISEDEQANTCYYKILRRFISSKPNLAEETLRRPGATLDAVGLKEIDTAWTNLTKTEKILRSAYMKLYVTSLQTAKLIKR